MRKILTLILSIIMLSMVCLMVACGNGDDYTVTQKPQQGISLNVTTLEMIVGDDAALIPSYEPIAGRTIEYESSDDTIIIVDGNGKVSAKTPGQATVTVKYGDQTATCSVNVGFGNLLPSAVLSGFSGESLQIAYGDTLNLNPYISFNNKEYFDGTFNYEYDQEVIEINSDGEITAKATGQTQVTVKASWLGINGVRSMEKTFTVKVTNVVSFIINGGKDAEFKIYSIKDDSMGCLDSMDFVATALFNDKTEVSDVDVEVVDGAEYFAYSDGKITSNGKYGSGKVKVSCNYGGEDFERIVNVNVLPVIYDYSETIEYSAMDGTLPLNDIFGKQSVLTKVVYNGKELAIDSAENVVTDVITVNGREKPAPQQITVYDQAVGYNVNAVIYTKILYDKEDLAVFKMETETSTLSGYYVLGNDINAYGYVHNTPNSACSSTGASGGLTGTFDGRGYSINNLYFTGTDATTGLFGLFGLVTNGTVKNVAFKNAAIQSGTGWQSLFAAVAVGLNMENVYVDLTITSSSNFIGALAFGMSGASTVKNCIFDVDYQKSGIYSGSLYASESKAPDTTDWSNVYVISQTILAHKTEFSGKPEYSTDAVNCGGTLKNIIRYNTVDDMKSANNDYSAFNNDYWQILNGIPAWHDIKQYVDSNINLNYSQQAESFDKDFNTLFAGYTEVESVSVGYEFAYSNGKAVITQNGQKDFVASGQTITLAAKVGDVWKSFDVKVCTTLIDEASDLAIFNLNGNAATTFPGYYMLTRSFDCGSYVHAAHNVAPSSTSGGLTGTFDGNGYTITGLKVTMGSGLFGTIYNGTVKNVAFVDAEIAGQSSGTGRFSSFFAQYSNKGTYIDVYLKAEVVSTHTGNGGALFYQITGSGSSVFERCIFDIVYTGLNATAYGTLSSAAGTGSGVRFTNSYMISTAPYYTDGKNSTINSLTGIEKYDNVAAMNSAILNAEDKAARLAAFDNGYWNVDSTTGAITFKSKV